MNPRYEKPLGPVHGGVYFYDGVWPENAARLDNNAIPGVIEMMRNGMPIDKARFLELDEKFGDEMRRIETDIRDIVGDPQLNVQSPDQIADLLFNKLKVGAPTKLTKSGKRPSVEKLAIECFAQSHPVIPKYLRFVELAKLRSTYTGPLPQYSVFCPGDKHRGEHYRVYTTIKAHRVATGRYSSGDRSKSPGDRNLQNIPIRSADGKAIRDAFVAPEGMVLVGVDNSQVEMRVAAELGRVKEMLQAFKDGKDIHCRTVELVQGLPLYSVPKDHPLRYPYKRVGFGVLYRIEPMGLQVQLNAEEAQDKANRRYWTEEECESLISNWYGAFPEVELLQGEYDSRIQLWGRVWDLFGRPMPVPEVHSAHPWIVEAGLRQASNRPIQATAVGLVKLAMAYITKHRICEAIGEGVRMLMQIHDELIFEAPMHLAKTVGTVVREIMQAVDHGIFEVPLVAEAHHAETWGGLK